MGSNVDRVLEIDGGVVTLADLSISGGGNVAQGGGILAQNATLSLQNTRVFGNLAYQAGAGIFASGSALNVQNSAISSNRTENSSPALGGGIAAVDSATSISGSSINDNAVYVSNDQTNAAVYGEGAEFTPGVGLSPLPIVT